MYKTFVEFRDTGKQYFYEGEDVIQAMRTQANLIQRFKNNNNVVAIGYEIPK